MEEIIKSIDVTKESIAKLGARTDEIGATLQSDSAAESSHVQVDERSLFEKIGGKAAVEAAVDIFYEKVLVDVRIKDFFEGVDMPGQRNKQKAFLTFAFGGAPNYSGENMCAAHKHLVEKGLDETHFDAVIENLGATLKELSVPDDLINEAVQIALSTKWDVLNR